MTPPTIREQRWAALVAIALILAVAVLLTIFGVSAKESPMPRRYDTAQDAADAMAEGRDVNAERRARLEGFDTRSGGERAKASMNEGIDSAKGWIGQLFGRKKPEHHDKSPGTTSKNRKP